MTTAKKATITPMVIFFLVFIAHLFYFFCIFEPPNTCDIGMWASISSIDFTSSWVSFISADSIFSSSLFTFLVPGIGTIYGFFASIHAREICAGVAFFSSLKLRIRRIPVSQYGQTLAGLCGLEEPVALLSDGVFIRSYDDLCRFIWNDPESRSGRLTGSADSYPLQSYSDLHQSALDTGGMFYRDQKRTRTDAWLESIICSVDRS